MSLESQQRTNKKGLIRRQKILKKGFGLQTQELLLSDKFHRAVKVPWDDGIVPNNFLRFRSKSLISVKATDCDTAKLQWFR